MNAQPQKENITPRPKILGIAIACFVTTSAMATDYIG
jgi:hypothetical protein